MTVASSGFIIGKIKIAFVKNIILQFTPFYVWIVDQNVTSKVPSTFCNNNNKWCSIYFLKCGAIFFLNVEQLILNLTYLSSLKSMNDRWTTFEQPRKEIMLTKRWNSTKLKLRLKLFNILVVSQCKTTSTYEEPNQPWWLGSSARQYCIHLILRVGERWFESRLGTTIYMETSWHTHILWEWR